MGFAESTSWNVTVVRVPLERVFLARLRGRALRCRAWFKLEVEDRRFLDLVIAAVDNVRSRPLAWVLEPILRSLMEAMVGFRYWMEALYGRVVYLMMVRGGGLALRLSSLAQDWGDKSASDWAGDQGFIQYLTVIELKRSDIWC
ncbi:hypothetical protein KEJ17_07565 [Candidatus Bathyarchaeota archaeon]|nr:hypothetical protein [Candidatus Bathyarchaeota archaeon]